MRNGFLEPFVTPENVVFTRNALIVGGVLWIFKYLDICPGQSPKPIPFTFSFMKSIFFSSTLPCFFATSAPVAAFVTKEFDGRLYLAILLAYAIGQIIFLFYSSKTLGKSSKSTHKSGRPKAG